MLRIKKKKTKADSRYNKREKIMSRYQGKSERRRMHQQNQKIISENQGNGKRRRMDQQNQFQVV